MADAVAALERHYPEIESELLVGTRWGRWVGTPDNSEKNQFGSIVLTDAAAYVYKKPSPFSRESAYRIPMAAAQFEIKSNPTDRSGNTMILYLDEVPNAEDQQTYREAVARDDIKTVMRIRTSGHRFGLVDREAHELQALIQRAGAQWMQNHQWREAGFGSRLEYDRSLNAAGSPIPMNRDEMMRAQMWIQEEGLSRQDAQNRILDEREAAE